MCAAEPKQKRKQQKKKQRKRKPKREGMLSRLTTVRLEQREVRMVVFGHSYVERMEGLGVTQEKRNVAVKYIYKSGATYETFIHDESLLHEVGTYDPHYIFVMLAGNSVGSPASMEDIQTSCGIFYAMLREFARRAIIVAVQAENRFYEPDNKWGAPTGTLYQKKRKTMNRFLLYQLCNKDFILQTGAKNNQESRSWYAYDGVHMTKRGYKGLLIRMRQVLNHIHHKIDERLQEEEKLQDALEEKIKARKFRNREGKA